MKRKRQLLFRVSDFPEHLAIFSGMLFCYLSSLSSTSPLAPFPELNGLSTFSKKQQQRLTLNSPFSYHLFFPFH